MAEYKVFYEIREAGFFRAARTGFDIFEAKTAQEAIEKAQAEAKYALEGDDEDDVGFKIVDVQKI